MMVSEGGFRGFGGVLAGGAKKGVLGPLGGDPGFPGETPPQHEPAVSACTEIVLPAPPN